MTTSLPASPDTDLIARLAKEIFADSPAAGTSPAPTGTVISDYPTDAKEIAPPVHPDAPASGSQTIQPVESASGGHAASSEEAYPFGEPRCYRDEGQLSSKPSTNPAPPAAVLPYTSDSLSDFYFLRGSEGAQVSSLPVPTSHGGQGLVLPAFNVEAVRRDFPALHQKVNGKPLIWLDNAATTHKPQSVIDATSYFYSHDNSNIHRAAYELAERATRAYEGARSKVREFIGAADAKEIVFLRGTTEAINLVAQSYGRKNIGQGDEILITNIEHHANIVPWQLLAEQTGAVIRVAPVNDRGELILDQFNSLLSGRTKLVSVTHVANSIGTINPVEQIIAISHAYGVPVLVDAAQSTPHMPVNVTALDVDFLVFSGHKVFGPTGIGALYGKSALLEAMPPWQGGGHMIRNVTFSKTTYQNAPEKFEAGTPDIAGAVGLGAAIGYLQNVGLAPIAAYEHELLAYATEGLQSVRGLRLIGTAANKASVLSFVISGYEPEKIAEHLDQQGIAARAGHHCAQPALRRFGVEKTVRASLAFYNTREEVDVLVQALHRLKKA
ncbi:MAG: cysteine desulfurase [Methylacidiphilales bacterium]|nr:cysteine desulfurase [Candidatus Methylacidiphilales bacterium]